MRFIPDGPDIPEDLLTARDNGDVIFFCGAGVSRAFANLPGFEFLGQKVIDDLGSAADSPARKLLSKAFAMGRMAGVGGLLATDRVFSLLEREFEIDDVRRAVAGCVRPQDSCDLYAHRLLLSLATSPRGVTRLVTTNFDLLFEACNTALKAWGPPKLPDPHDPQEFNGIIHLHGRVDDLYERPRDTEFVVSSADFGRAYLSDGWATRFIQSLLDRFKIVFVGYSADDPPVQYLLEALKLSASGSRRMYAFQDGAANEATALWEHRGVHAIPFISTNGFGPLWDTLAAWANRCNDVKIWHDTLFAEAAKGPGATSAHFRGQIANIVATMEGARHLAHAQTTLDAGWLLVCDPACRYARSQPMDGYSQDGAFFSAFNALGLDGDIPPAPEYDQNRFSERKVPAEAFAPLICNGLDVTSPTGDEPIGLFSSGLAARGSLPSRLVSIGAWLNRVAHEPIALWWAADQSGLHPSVVEGIELSLGRTPSRFTLDVRRGWRMLLASWADKRPDPDYTRYLLEARAQSDGWSPALVRDLVAIYRPKLQVHRAYATPHPLLWGAVPPDGFIRAEVDYPRPHDELRIPDALLNYGVSLFRANLEFAVALETDIRGAAPIYLETTRPDDGDATIPEDSYGLTGPVAQFQNLIARLLALDPDAARAEVARWPVGGSAVFTRLRIWAASQPLLTTAEEAAKFFAVLSDEDFWSSTHDRDLLFALRDRWNDLGTQDRLALEERLRTGSWTGALEPTFDTSRMVATERLNRLYWLSQQSIKFSFDLERFAHPLREAVPDWRMEFAASAADSRAPHVMDISVDDDPGTLTSVSVRKILSSVDSVTRVDFNNGIRREPFRGLSTRRPARALKALSVQAKAGAAPASAWSDFLSSEVRKTDTARLIAVIAGRLGGLPPDALSTIAYSVIRWIETIADKFRGDTATTLVTLWGQLIKALSLDPGPSRHRPDRDWAEDALNSPAGRLTLFVLGDPAITSLEKCQRLPTTSVTRLEQLLALPGDHRRHVLNLLGFHYAWLDHVDPAWSEANLLPTAMANTDDATAFWDGFLRHGQAPRHQVFSKLKSIFLARARQPRKDTRPRNNLAPMLLRAWGAEPITEWSAPLLTDVELRDLIVDADNEFRRQILWHLGQWSKMADTSWPTLTPRFLKSVWPKQRTVRNSKVSGYLVDLAFGSGDLMPVIAQLVLPRLVPSGSSRLFTLALDVEKPDFAVRKFPAAALDLLWAILPEDRRHFPYQFDRILTVLEEATPTAADPRLIELRRRLER